MERHIDRFEAMLSPFSADQFLSQYWERSPLHIRNTAQPHKFHELPAIGGLPQLLAGELRPDGRWAKRPVVVQASMLDADQRVRDLGVMPASSFEQLYNAGASLCFSPVDHAHPVLREWVAAVSGHTALAGNVGITCYLTPPRSGGPMHFDAQHVFFCQAEGEKHWRFGTRPAMAAPPFNIVANTLASSDLQAALASAGFEVRRPEDCELTEVVLEPGDVLYLPPGTWHEPRTRDHPSLHYTFTLTPLGFGELLFAILRTITATRTDWRRDLRFIDAASATDPPRFFAERFAELQQEIARMSPEDAVSAFRQTSRIDALLGRVARG